MMGGEEQETPLLEAESAHHNNHIKRRGTIWTAVAHIITGVIGAGVLSLAWSTAQLGWIAGPLCILCFAFITLIATYLLTDCYRSPDPEIGPVRHPSYLEAVRIHLGEKRAWICGVFVYVNLYGTCVAYVITSAISMRAIQKSNCYHKEGHDAPCDYGDTLYMLIFAAAQLVLSQIPDFHNMDWLSVVAAAMSFTYSFIGFALGLANVIENGYVKGSITGVAASSVADKVWNISQALGDIAFAYPYSIILINIQDTLRSPPPENETMKKASTIAIVVTTFFYLCCGGFGYAAFGDDTPGNLLTGFGFYEPYWLIDLANACIVLHLLGGYQIFSQPLFASFEKWITGRHPNSRILKRNLSIKLGISWGFELSLLKLCLRTMYVITTAAIAMTFPYFNQVIGVLGAFNFWPIAIYFPVEMYLKQWHVQAWTGKWILLHCFSIFCFFVTAFALVGSIEGVIEAKLS